MKAKKILIIDDDEVTAHIYQDKLRMEGYIAEVAGDGAIALEMLQQAPVDLVILDLALPVMNGMEVLKAIRSRPETRALPVIVFSNTYLTGLMQAAWKAGATKCLAKAHCTPQEMLQVVIKQFAFRDVGKPPGTPATIPFSGSPSIPNPSPARSDLAFQNDLIAGFVAKAPQTLAEMRQCLQSFVRPERENLRLVELDAMGRLTRSLTGAAGVAGFQIIAQMSSALEALLTELHARPAEITPSTVQTVAHAIDKLARLVESAGTLTRHGVAPDAPMIMVVDDEIISRELIVRGLTKVGLRALVLDNSTLALQVLEQNSFDLVFLDLKMPKPDGFETCELLRQMPLNRATPVMFATAASDFQTRTRTILSGGTDFIIKPFLLLELAVKALTWLYNENLKPLSLDKLAKPGSEGQKNELGKLRLAPLG